MNNAAMTFDAGTWWLIGLLVIALIGAVVFLVNGVWVDFDCTTAYGQEHITWEAMGVNVA